MHIICFIRLDLPLQNTRPDPVVDVRHSAIDDSRVPLISAPGAYEAASHHCHDSARCLLSFPAGTMVASHVLADTPEDNLEFITSKLQAYASRPRLLEHRSHMAGSTTHQALDLSLIQAQPS